MPLKLEIITMEKMSMYMFHSVLTAKRMDEIQEYIDIMVCNWNHTYFSHSTLLKYARLYTYINIFVY